MKTCVDRTASAENGRRGFLRVSEDPVQKRNKPGKMREKVEFFRHVRYNNQKYALAEPEISHGIGEKLRYATWIDLLFR